MESVSKKFNVDFSNKALNNKCSHFVDEKLGIEEMIRDTHQILKRMEKDKVTVDDEKKNKFVVDGKDLMLIPARDPIKFCLQAMFSREEMEKSGFKETRKRGLKDPLPTLDQTKVKLIDDAIIARFGMEQFNDTAAKVRTQANQKCSDLLTKKKRKRLIRLLY
ncbi:hypothetical protein EMCRGX_G007006 [Ephydatia muelleri]